MKPRFAGLVASKTKKVIEHEKSWDRTSSLLQKATH